MRVWNVAAIAIPALVGCAAEPHVNPSFPLTPAQARAALDDMGAQPQELIRPLIVLGGLYDPGWSCDSLIKELQKLVEPGHQILYPHFRGLRSFEDCAARLVDAVDEQFVSEDPAHTVEVDVIGCSMGGLVARHAASPEFSAASGKRRLRINRLFTISTPHRGAKSAFDNPIDPRIADMVPGSEFITSLMQGDPCYEIIPYVCLNDGVVGEENAAPAEQNPWWIRAPPLTAAHMAANGDPRIIADIAKRLRGEQAFTLEPAAELPPRRKLRNIELFR